MAIACDNFHLYAFHKGVAVAGRYNDRNWEAAATTVGYSGAVSLSGSMYMYQLTAASTPSRDMGGFKGGQRDIALSMPDITLSSALINMQVTCIQ